MAAKSAEIGNEKKNINTKWERAEREGGKYKPD